MQWASDLIRRDGWAVLDTETTGCGERDEIVEIAVVGAAGGVLLEQTLRPERPVSGGAARLHGLTDEALRLSPPFLAIYPRLSQLLTNRFVVAYNAAFDRRMLSTGCRRAGTARLQCRWQCALDRYEQLRGFRPPLHIACEIEEIPVPAGRHRAAVDARLVWELVQRMAVA